MSGTENNPTGTLDERLRLGAGFAPADRPRIRGALYALAPHLSGWEHDQVEVEVSLKDTEGADQKVTLQVWPAGRAHFATSHERDLDHGANLASAADALPHPPDPARDSAVSAPAPPPPYTSSPQPCSQDCRRRKTGADTECVRS
jgi:hypothetical protein